MRSLTERRSSGDKTVISRDWSALARRGFCPIKVINSLDIVSP